MHFDTPGSANTEKPLEIAFDSARERKVDHIVVASTGGHTARLILDRFPYRERNVVVVTHNTGFREPGAQEFPTDLKDALVAAGVKVLTGTMVLRGLGTAIRGLMGYSEQDLVAATLRMVCQASRSASSARPWPATRASSRPPTSSRSRAQGAGRYGVPYSRRFIQQIL
jgi:hypothetical protein